ncbi:type II secretion system F family protein [Cohnella soli]|uniref:Type II secretion system F family protein n=1 Tax=Cohnella soli TaxID=425005 RepID=A0ABW0HRX4_9BACL
MDSTLVVFILLSLLFVFLAALPLLNRNTQISDRFYSILLAYRNTSAEGKNRGWIFTVNSISPYMNKWLIGRLDRMLRLAGRKSGRTAEETLVIYAASVIPLLLLASQLEHAKTQAMIMALGYPIIQIRRLMTKGSRRQLEAEEATRFLKRQLALNLRQKIPTMDALWMMAKDHPGEFGETFRGYLEQIEDGKPLRQAMKEFRSEYETRSLDDLCFALELSDTKTPEILANQIERQAMDENARVDEFIEKKRDSSKTTMLLIVGLSFVLTIAILVFFASYGFADYFRGGGGFLNW